MPPISVTAPTRIADLGGWTDTWFAGHGAVCHLTVWPGVEVTLKPHDGPPGVEVRVASVDREWHWSPGTPAAVCPDPLLGACLDENEIPDGGWLLEVRSEVPPGAAMGGSASVCVAVLRALDRLRGVEHDPAEIVRRAHAVETRRLGQESGVQDHWAATAGGINLVTVSRYPEATCADVVVPVATRAALQECLIVVLLPEPHVASVLHTQVIAALGGASATSDPRLAVLRDCAQRGAAALTSGDLEAYGAVLTRNTETQALLHPALVAETTRQVIAPLPADDLLGWKVNGAGGTGGSLTLLAASAEARGRLVERLAEPLRVLDVRLAPRHPALAGSDSAEVV